MTHHRRELAPLTLAVAAVAAAGFVWAQQPAGGGQPDRAPRQPGDRAPRGERPSVEQSMRLMNRGANQLKAGINDPTKKDESLQAVWLIQRGCLGAKAAKPEHLEGDPEKMLDAFRRGQIKLMGLLLELETAVLDGKTDQANAAFAKIVEHRDASHKFLGVDMEEHGEEGEEPPRRPGGGGGGS